MSQSAVLFLSMRNRITRLTDWRWIKCGFC